MKQLRSRKRSQQWIAVLLAVVMVVGHMAMASAYDPNAGDTNVPILDLTMGGGVSGDGGVGDGSGTGGNGVVSGSSDGEFVYDLTEGTILNDPTQQGENELQGDGEDEFVLDPETFNDPNAADFEVLFSVYPDRVLENGEIAEVRLTVSSTGGENSRIPPDTKISIEFPSFIPSDSLESAAAELASSTRNHVIKDNYSIVGGTGERKTLTMYTNELTGDNTWMIALLMRLRIDKYYYNGDNSVVISVGNSTSTGEIHVEEGNIGEDLFVRKELLNAKESFGNKYIDGAVGKYMVDIQLPKLVNTVDVDGQPMMVTITDQVQNPKFMLCTEDGEFDAAAIEAELRAAIIAGLMASTPGMTQDEANAIIHSFKFIPEGSGTPSGFEIKLIGETDAPVKIKLFYYFTAIDPSTITSNEFIRNEVRVTYGEFEVTDDVEVLANDTAAALWRKSINDGKFAMLLNEAGLVPLPISGVADVTFEFLITALGSPSVSKGQIIVDDYLDPEFIYKDSAVHSGTLEEYAALFTDAHTPLVDAAIGVYGNKLDPTNRLVKIASNKRGSLTDTYTTVTFTTGMDLSQILPGMSGKNKVGGDVVYVYREAELEVGKTWQTATGDDVKSDVVFELYNKNGVLVGSATLTQAQMNNGETARIRFSYLTDSILDGVNAYTLKEKLVDEENSTYASAPDQTIYIEKYTDDVNHKRGVRFTDASGTPIGEYHGLHKTAFENPYDDGLGKIAFAKYGKKKQGGMELLDGAEFTIHMGVATAFDANGKPTAVNESTLIPVNVTETDGAYTYASVGGEGSILKTNGGVAKIGELPYKVTVGDITYDTYVIRETTPPPDYDYDATKTLYYKLGKNNKNDENTDYRSSANYFLNNFYEDGQISITKVGEDGEPLAGAQFTLTRGTLEDGTFTPEPGFSAIVAPRNGTGDDGVVTFTGLTNGLYEIKETKAPFGYKGFTGAIYVTIDHAGNASVTAVVKTDGMVEVTPVEGELKGKTITLTWENEIRYGWIEFTKVDKTSKNPLAGATFALYQTDDKFENRVPYMVDDGNGSEEHYKITTDDTGFVKFEPLRFGYYIVVEESTDDEHFIPDDMKEIRFIVNDEAAAAPGVDIGTPGNYQWPNPKRGRLEFTKVDWEDTLIALEGAEFTLYKLVNGEPVLYEYESAEFGVNPVTTKADGVVAFEKLPHGNYRVVETGAPKDNGDIKYYWDPDNMPSVDFEVTETNFSVIGTMPGHYGNKLWRNPRLGSIEFMKVDSAGKPLSGAIFTLERQTGPNSWVDVATSPATDNTGMVVFNDLPHGTYRVKESTAPSGYFGNVTEVIFTVGRTTTSTPALDAPNGTMRWENLKKGSIEFFKVDERNKATGLAGAEFTLYSVTGSGASERATEITTAVSGENGRVFFDGLAHGVYKVVETKAPAGFMIDETNPPTVYFQVGETSSVIPGRGNAALTDLYYWLNAPRKASIVVQKYDLVDPSDPDNLVTKPLQGVTFRLYRDMGTGVDPEQAGPDKTTGTDGKATFTAYGGGGLLAGTYYIVETDVPAGYEKDPRYATLEEAMKHPITLGVLEDETEVWLTTVEVTNPRVLKDVTFIKGDETTAGVLAGAKFKLTSTSTLNGVSITREATAGGDGKVTFKDVPYGVYTLTETEPPKGYAPIAPITGIEVNDAVTGAAKDLGRINDYPYELIVTKSNLEPGETETTYLPDAEFQIYVEIGNVKNYVMATPPTVTPGGGTPESIYVYEGLTTSASEATTFVTDANGKLVVEKMAYQTNKYWVVETKAPENFVIDPTPREVIFNETSSGAKIVKTVDVPNGAVRGGLEITKVDGTNNAPLSGVVFEVKRQGAADGEELILTTGNDGKASANNLLYGTYEIREVETKRGYKAILVDEAGNEVDVLTVVIRENGVTVKVKTIENYPVVGKVGLLKQGQTLDNGYEPLEGAQFLLKPITLTWDEETGSITNAVVSTNRSTFRYENSGADGSVVFEDLAYGAYIIEESMYAEGYEDGEAQPYVVVQVGLTEEEFESLRAWFEANYSEEEYAKLRFEYREWEGEEIPPITWRNRLVFGSLSFLKTDGDGSPLSEALFELYWIDGNNNDALVPVTLTKTEDGVFLFEGLNGTATEINTNTAGKGYIGELPYGRYTLRETKAPDNHRIEQEYHDFFVYGGHKNVSLTVKNPECAGTLRVIKKDAGSENIFLSGAVVSVYHENDEGKPGKLFGTVETQIGGTGYLYGLPIGKYIAIETKAPDGYSLNAVNSKSFEITSENIDEQVSVELTYENTPISYSMRILKVELDESGNKVPVKVAGAEFLVNNTETNGYWYPKTNADGIAELTGIPAGNYTVQETRAPAGYVRDDTVYTITVDNEEETVEISIVNERILGGVRIRKVDKDEAMIEGAKFALYAEGSTEPMKLRATGTNSYVPDENGGVTEIAVGEATITELPAGTYRLVETVVPDDYIKLDEERVFTITDQNYQALVEVDVLNIKNEAAIAIRKVDATNNNVYLPGAVFQLYRNVNGVYEYVKSATSNSSGYALFSGLEVGSYRIDEVAAPGGYKLWVNPLYFEVKNDLKIAIGNSEYTMVNDVVIVPIANHKANYDFQLRKVDADTRSVLSGATFSLTGTGSVSSYYTTLTSGTSGLTERVSLAKGTYILQELAAPSGYQRTTATFTVVVDDDGVSVDGVRLAGPNVFTYEVENTPTSRTALIYKTDSGTRAPLSGAVFSVTQRGTGNTRTLTTGSNGTTGTITLVPGYSYDIVETAAPSGYNRPMQGWTVTISSTGTISVSGRGITAYNDTGRIVINIDNTRTTTTTTPGTSTTPTPRPTSGGSSSGSSSSGSSSSGGSSSSTRPSTSSEEPIPLGPGLPRTGQYTNVGLLILGAVIMLISCAALMLYVLKGRREEEGNYDVMSL